MEDTYYHGGHRPNSGRHPVEDKKVQVYIMIRGSKVESLGGKDMVKQLLQEIVDGNGLEKHLNQKIQ